MLKKILVIIFLVLIILFFINDKVSFKKFTKFSYNTINKSLKFVFNNNTITNSTMNNMTYINNSLNKSS